MLQLEDLGITDDVWLQQDGTWHIMRLVFVNTVVRFSRCVGFTVWSPWLPAPLGLPPRNPDPLPCDNCLWGFLKETVAQQCYQTTVQLKEAVRLAFTRVTLHMLQQCPTEHHAVLFFVMRVTEHKQIHWTLVPPNQFTAVPFSVGKETHQEAFGTEASSQVDCLYWLLDSPKC